MMVISRRAFVAGSLVAVGVAASVATLSGKTFYSKNNALQDPFFLSACNDHHGNHFIGSWSLSGQQHFQIPVTHRAHGSCCSPDKTVGVFFARRPGTQLYIVDLINSQLRYTMNATSGYHYYGHGVFSHDGRYLFTSEHNYQHINVNKSGIIAVYDTYDTDNHGFKRVAEYQSGGIGPHQLALLNDGHTLVIANGGILTHPSQQRKKLNLNTMKPSLTYMDSRSGMILDQFYPADFQMSIRHLAVTSTDQVIIGVQYQGDKHHQVPLVLSHKGEYTLQAMHAEHAHWHKQNHYIASIAVDNNARFAISTSPRGAGVSLWDLSTLQCAAQVSVRDVAGAAYMADSKRFLISNGLGQLLSLPVQKDTFSAQPVFLKRTICWDNHLSLVS